MQGCGLKLDSVVSLRTTGAESVRAAAQQSLLLMTANLSVARFEARMEGQNDGHIALIEQYAGQTKHACEEQDTATLRNLELLRLGRAEQHRREEAAGAGMSAQTHANMSMVSMHQHHHQQQQQPWQQLQLQ